METPVLFLVFNRPDTTSRVLEAIRRARPDRLYIASDGPRADRLGEAEAVAETRRLVMEGIDWSCQIKTLFRDRNQGCRLAISSALDWFFSLEPEGIVLEDDCLPADSFFRFCQEMLERYRDEERVMCVSGDGFLPDTASNRPSYVFTSYPLIWGWAAWRRSWARFELEFKASVLAEGDQILHRRFPGFPTVRRHWAHNFQLVGDGHADTWDSQWVYAVWKHDGICIAPSSNLVSNIGFNAQATNAVEDVAGLGNLPLQELAFPLVHPETIAVAPAFDLRMHHEIFRIPRPTWRELALNSCERLWRTIRSLQGPWQQRKPTAS